MDVRTGFLAIAFNALGVATGPAIEPPQAPAAHTVSELVVTATRAVSELLVTGQVRCLPPERGNERASRPKVVSSFPARGAEVRPGLLVVRVTFDQPMACTGRFEAAAPLPDPCPGEVRKMLLSYDRRTVRTVCVVGPGSEYAVSLGQDPSGPTFIGLSGLPALPAKIAFRTSAGPVLSDVCEALEEDPMTAETLTRRRKTCAGP